MIRKIAIYARYSTDHQKPTSIDDQVADCKRYVNKELAADDSETTVFSDSAQSGQSSLQRSGYNKMLEEVRNEKISCLVVEGLDRLSRDLGDIAQFYRIC